MGSVRRTSVLVGALALTVAGLGVVVLAGWALDQERLTRVLPGLVTMQPATALDFTLLGLSTAMLHLGWARARVPEAVPLLAVLTVVLIAGTGLVTELAGWRYPITVLGDMSQNEGRMSGITAVAPLVICVSLLAAVFGRRLVAHGAGVLALTLGVVGLSGYAFGASDLYDVGYFQTHRHHMDYPTYRRKGWPIGSGVTESAVKLFNKRVKGTEQFWNVPGVETILALRGLWLSQDGRWQTYWNTRPAYSKAA